VGILNTRKSETGILGTIPITPRSLSPRELITLSLRIHDRLIAETDAATLSQLDRHTLAGSVNEIMNSMMSEDLSVLPGKYREPVISAVIDEVLGYGPLQTLLNDPNVSEIMVNGPFQVFIERDGQISPTEQVFRDSAHVMRIIDKIISPLGRRIDESSPMVDGRLPDGSRINAIIHPLAIKGPFLTIRKFSADPFTVDDLMQFGTLTRDMADFLSACIRGGINIIVSGGTATGKTTTLNALSSYISDRERIITIEDAAELQLQQTHVLGLEARPENMEGIGHVTIRMLVRNALRMRPDRIIVGECRGGEALDMLQAMNTGHDGSLTTLHANSPRHVISRLQTMVLMAGTDLPSKAILDQISAAINLIVHQTRLIDGQRKITHITEITGANGEDILMDDVFLFDQEGVDSRGRVIGAHCATGYRPVLLDKLKKQGITLPDAIFDRRCPA
jgi:pilus assembly protein CpaF